jgi:hypothetical protein
VQLTFSRIESGRYQCDQDSDITIVRHASDGRWRVKYKGRMQGSVVSGPFVTLSGAKQGAQTFYDKQQAAARRLVAEQEQPAPVAVVAPQLHQPPARPSADIAEQMASAVEAAVQECLTLAGAVRERELDAMSAFDLDIEHEVMLQRLKRRAAYDALREVHTMFVGWLQGAKEEHGANGRRDVPESWLTEHDFPRILTDAARQLGIGEQWDAAYPKGGEQA